MFSVTITRDDYEFLRSSLFTEDGMENAAFAVCGFSVSRENTRLFVRNMMSVPLSAYVHRSEYHLEIAPSFINHVIDECDEKLAIINIHSHPGRLSPRYSGSDDYGERRLFSVYADLLPEIPHASLLFGDRQIDGRYWRNGSFRKIDLVRIIGEPVQDVLLGRRTRGTSNTDSEVHNRQILAFGNQTQLALTRMKIGIVGLGGTGSSVAEQLTRIGISDFVLVDNDKFEPSNLTRMSGSMHDDIESKETKTRIVARNLKSINPRIFAKTIEESVVYQEVLMALRDCEVIFCCTDNDWSRSLLNRFAYQYFVPVIDMGTRIVVENKQIVGAAGRVSIVGPGMPCLWCSHHLDSERIRAESMDANERMKLQKEQYVQGLVSDTPSVISLNTTVSSIAVTLFLSLISDFSKVPRVATEQIYDAMEGIVFTSKPISNPNCSVCGVNGLKGLGDTQVVSSFGVSA